MKEIKIKLCFIVDHDEKIELNKNKYIDKQKISYGKI